jgi:hypothetical protein
MGGPGVRASRGTDRGIGSLQKLNGYGLTARDDVPAEVRRFGNGVGPRGQRNQGAIGEDLPALVEAMVGVLAGFSVNDPVRIAHLLLEPTRQSQAARMDGQPVPSIRIVGAASSA